MPHIHLETTADLHENADVPDILEALVLKLSTFETVSSPSIKAYHTLRSFWVMGEGAAPGFAHCTLAVLSGRPLELRKAMADGLWAELRERFVYSLENQEVALTIEVREMEKETYLK